jgi:hypothetical protein
MAMSHPIGVKALQVLFLHAGESVFCHAAALICVRSSGSGPAFEFFFVSGLFFMSIL